MEIQRIMRKGVPRSQNPAGLPPRVGSIPTSGTSYFDKFPFSVLNFEFVGL